MDKAFHSLLRSIPAYQARIEKAEASLCGLIARYPDSRQLSHYLIFLLAANGRYADAARECRRILDVYPDDPVALLWKELIRLRWHDSRCRSRPGHSPRQHRRWQRVSPTAC